MIPGPLTTLLLLLAVGPGECDASGAGLSVWTTHALEKVRPTSPPGPRRSVDLHAARNEFEPFQVVLRAEECGLDRIDVEVSDLVAKSGDHRLSNRHATVYRVGFVDLETPSSVDGDTGPWPDPLIPRIDPWLGERRNGFPFDLRPRRSQPLWIELYIPLGTPPGIYEGRLRIAASRRPIRVIPFRLTVWPFDLPSTSTLASSYGLSGVRVLEQHLGGYTSDRDLYDLTRRYTEAALRHRISVHGASMVPPGARFLGGEATLDWSSYDAEIADLMEGAAFGPDEPLPGARLTSLDVRTPSALADEELLLYWGEWEKGFRERGWLDRLFLYLWDEPQGPEDYEEVRRRGELARSAHPDLPILLTEQLTPALDGVVDIWVTLINCLEQRPGVEADCEATVPRSAYRAAERSGDRLWWYQSCASHGCDVVGRGPAYTGWPSYVIDAPATAHRIMPWLAWTFQVQGELYYNTVESWSPGEDPWTRVRVHGGNGDGTLFYPGTPSRIGGRTHVPVESLRLKLIREGFEDYEYLALLAEQGPKGRELATDWSRRLAPHTYRWDASPDALYAARRAIARAISEGGA